MLVILSLTFSPEDKHQCVCCDMTSRVSRLLATADGDARLSDCDPRRLHQLNSCLNVTDEKTRNARFTRYTMRLCQ